MLPLLKMFRTVFVASCAGTELWAAREPGMVALLDPITGLAVRLVHVQFDGSLALVPAEGCEALLAHIGRSGVKSRCCKANKHSEPPCCG